MTEHRIPTILGLLLLVTGVAVGVILVQQQQIFRLGASPEITPKNVRVTNITEGGFTVSWVTEAATVGFVLFGERGELSQTAQDDQDVEKQPIPRVTHHFTLSGLAPTTSYSFKIGSGKQTFDSSGKPWEQTTGSRLPPRVADIISGTVATPTGTPVGGAIVYVTFATAQPLSVVTNQEGRWSLTISNARTSKLSSYAIYDKGTVLSLFVQGGAGQVSSAQVTVANARPTPPMMLGQTHDFRKTAPQQDTTSPRSTIQLPPSSPSPIPTGGTGFSLEPIESPQATPSAKLSVTNPKEGEGVATTLPEFGGTGPAGVTLTITLESPTISAKVKVASDGTWKWSPAKPLSLGSHKLTVASGNQTLTRNFTVLAAGSSLPALTATPSGKIATASPTPKPSPTSTPSARVSRPSTEAGVPVAGDLTITFLLFILGIVTIFGGLILFRKA